MLDFGATWYLLDHRSGSATVTSTRTRIGAFDLRRYNVIYLPERWRRRRFPQALLGRARRLGARRRYADRCRQRGPRLTSAEKPLVATRRSRPSSARNLAPYQDAIHREWLAGQPRCRRRGHLGESRGAGGTISVEQGRRGPEAGRAQARRCLAGAVHALRRARRARVDTAHWLAAGTPPVLPVLFSNSPVLMAAPPVEAPIRIGVYAPAGESRAACSTGRRCPTSTSCGCACQGCSGPRHGSASRPRPG
jgi:hypothetical protein